MAIGIGEALATAREERGRTLEEASRATRVRAEYLVALEDEDFGALGGDVYAKGFLRTYARYLGLDPEPLLTQYRRYVETSGYDPHALVEHPVARQPREGPPTWFVWVAVAVVVTVIALAVVGTVGGRTPQQAAPDTTDRSVRSPTQEPTGDSGVTTRPSPTPSPSPTGVELALLLEERSWVRVRIEQRTVFEDTLPAGETKQFRAPARIEVRLGNAGGVRLVLNGRDLGSPAGRGEAVTVLCDPQDCAPA
ncbi:MAG TPA: RodZ domain-containing protein [Nitriliruptorales bacterium]|nr:RodZ domain-containing protein [Nitriliruptorales bacterium]